MGRAKYNLSAFHLIDFGKAIDVMIEVNISGRRSNILRPSISFTAKQYFPLDVSTTFISSALTPCEPAKPIAALVGFPFSSKATFAEGPFTSCTISSCLCGNPLANNTNLLGVPVVCILSKPIRFFLTCAANSSSICFRAGSI